MNAYEVFQRLFMVNDMHSCSQHGVLYALSTIENVVYLVSNCQFLGYLLVITYVSEKINLDV